LDSTTVNYRIVIFRDCTVVKLKSRCSKVCNRLQTARPGFKTPDGQEICIFFIASGPLWCPFSLLCDGYRGTEKKRPESEAEHSSPCCTEVKNGGAITLLPHMFSWHVAYFIKYGDTFTFYLAMVTLPVAAHMTQAGILWRIHVTSYWILHKEIFDLWPTRRFKTCPCICIIDTPYTSLQT
jgi:hypothetical protein